MTDAPTGTLPIPVISVPVLVERVRDERIAPDLLCDTRPAVRRTHSL